MKKKCLTLFVAFWIAVDRTLRLFGPGCSPSCCPCSRRLDDRHHRIPGVDHVDLETLHHLDVGSNLTHLPDADIHHQTNCNLLPRGASAVAWNKNAINIKSFLV